VGDPIAELLAGLENDRRPPLPWVVRWSEGGCEPVAAAWALCDVPAVLTRALRLAGDRRVVVRALAAEVRTYAQDRVALATLDAAERWARGLLCIDEVQEHEVWCYAQRGESVRGPGPYDDRVVAHCVAYAARCPDRGCPIIDLDSVQDSVETGARNAGVPPLALAAAVRAAVPVPPTLAQLLAPPAKGPPP
jgi:hypothetical protein